MPPAARPWLPYAALLLAGLLAWQGSVHSGTVNFDTPWLVTDNPILSTGQLRWIPTILWDMERGTRLVLGAEYLPVRDLTVLADFALFGSCWACHHAVNLGWYLLGCLLFLALAERLLGKGPRAWLAAGLFALHPLHVESVAWLANRKDVVSLAFFMLATLLWLERRRWRWGLGLSLLCTALAVWSKNTAIVLPGVLVALSLLVERQDPRKARWWLQWLPFGLLVGACLAVSLSLGDLVAMYAPTRGGSLASALLLECRVLLIYLRMLVLPVGLSAVYIEPPLLPLAHPASLASLALVLALLAAIPLAARRAPMAALGLACFFLTLLPVSQLVPIQNLMADRYLLLPSAGLALLLASLWPADLRGRSRLALVLPGLALLGLGVGTAQRCLVWRDSVALWSDTSAKAPTSRVQRSLSGALVEAGRTPEAERVLRQALTERPDDAVLLEGLGWVRLKLGYSEEAEALFRRALDQDPSLRKASSNLISLLVPSDRAAEAAELGEILVAAHPLYAQGWNNLGSARLQLDDLQGAAQAFERALELDPFYALPACNLGVVGWRARNGDAARRWFQRCLELDADNAMALRALERLGGGRKAVDRQSGTGEEAE